MPDHSSVQQLLTEATTHYHSGEYRQAIQIWQRVLASDPDNQRAKEGIRMASLLLDEAQAAAEGTRAGAASSAPDSESPASIAKVREGIQKIREYLSSSKHLEAMEVCRSLLALAPRSAAVHEIVEEAREAYEAQPFIHEHLEIARQLFVQDRLDEATAELHKVFFLNPNQGEARKLEAKILALRQKRVPGAVPVDSKETAGEEPPPSSGGQAASSSASKAPGPQGSAAVPDFGDSVDLPQESVPDEPTTPANAEEAPGAGEEARDTGDRGPVRGENWEAELAQIDLGGRPAVPATPAQGRPEAPAGDPEEKMPIMHLSENHESPDSSPAGTPGPEEPGISSETMPHHGKADSDLDLSSLIDEEIDVAPNRPGTPPMVQQEESRRKSAPPRPASSASRSGSSGSIMRYALPLVGILIGGGAAWWYFGMQPSSSAGGGSAPPSHAPGPRRAGAAGSRNGGRGGSAQLGLSSSGSRTSGGTASAGVQVPAMGSGPAPPAMPLTPEETRREIARMSEEGRSLLQRGRYQDAAKSFSRVLDLDPANMDAKDLMDKAASKVLEQKKLEEDLQTAKEFFVEKDYESALRKFYRLPRDRNLGDLDLFIRNAWYNWAVVSMKGGNCVEALPRLKEVLTLDSDDQEALKQQEVAEHYKDRAKDRVFYAFTDRLTYRTLDQK